MKWNDNLSTKRKVNGKTISIGQQNFDNNTIAIKNEYGKILNLPMYSDEDGIYFVYCKTKIYLSDHIGNMPI